MADNTSTLTSSYVRVLSAQERTATGFTHAFRIPYTEVYSASLTTQGDTKTITLGSLPTKFLITRAGVLVTTAYATTGTLTVAVGTSTDPDNYVDDTTAKTAAWIPAASGGAPITLAGSYGVAGGTLVAQFTTQASTGALSDITAGDLTIYLGIVDTGKLTTGVA